MENQPLLNLSFFHELTTETGCKVSDIQPLNGHFLIYKIMLPKKSDGGITLPYHYRRRSIKNVSMILGFVLKSSQPWRRKFNRKTMVWDHRTESWKANWKVWDGKESYPSDIPEGVGVFYNSYNVGKLKVQGLDEPLVHIRHIDILATFPIENWSDVQVGGKAMERFNDKYAVNVRI